VDDYILRDIIERVHKRKHYYEEFHDLPDVRLSQHKIIGLYIYWILKLRPIWSERRPIHANDSYDMNDAFAWYLFKGEMYELDPATDSKRDEHYTEYHNEILYSFRYRDLTKESIILLFQPFVAVKGRQMKKKNP